MRDCDCSCWNDLNPEGLSDDYWSPNDGSGNQPAGLCCWIWSVGTAAEQCIGPCCPTGGGGMSYCDKYPKDPRCREEFPDLEPPIR